MKLETLNYGTIEYEEKDIIIFEKPLLGFDKLKKFVLAEIEVNSMFSALQSIEEIAVGFVVINPFSIKSDYEIKIDDKTIEELEIENPEDVAVLNTVTLNAIPEKITTNLRAPIIINVKNNKGKQIVLNNEDYSIKTPIMGGEKC
ncbi:MAG: flagellar assembly protein FliW [Sarcina sp.]